MFTVAPSGAVTRSPNSSAGAVRIRATAAPTPLITITCTVGRCNGQPVEVRISQVASSSRLSLVQWTPGAFTYASAALTVPPSGSNVVTFAVRFSSTSGSVTFRLGHSVVVSASGETGDADLRYRVTAGFDTAPATGGVTGTLRTKLFRAIRVEKDRDLVFGKIVRPGSGSGTVTIDPVSGVRTSTGGVVLVNDARAGPARFTTTGEGGRAVTVSVPAGITMNRAGGSETLVVETAASGAGGASLSGSPGGSGTHATAVGGTITVTATTLGGAYSGVINVTSSYN